MAGVTPRSRASLDAYRNEIARCVRCGACRAVCPSFLQSRLESLSARGRMALIQAVLEGRLSVSELYKDRLATCMGCMACEAVCASRVPVTEIIQAAKEAAVEETGRGVIERAVSAVLAHEGVMRSLAWFAPVALHYSGKAVRGRGARDPRSAEGGVRNKRPALSFGKHPRGRVVFFPGCAIRHFQQDIENAAVTVLGALGYDVLISDELKCCGRPFLSLGDRRAAEGRAEHNTAVLEALRSDAVITACASCGLTFKREYSALLARSAKIPVPVQDIHEFLADKVHDLDLQPLRMRVTWHDPCHLGRGQGLAKIARDVVRAVPGIDLAEMAQADQCCGFGGVMRIAHHGLSDAVAALKVKDIAAAKASFVLTGCPGCRMQIAEGVRRADSDIGVLHTVQLLEKALRNACPARSGNEARLGVR